MIYDERQVEILDRKYNFVIQSPDRFFLLELQKFVDFLLNDERFRAYSEILIREMQEKFDKFVAHLKEIKPKVVALRKRLVELYPQIDDSNTPRPSGDPSVGNYRFSLAYFDDLAAKEDPAVGRIEQSQPYLDNTDVGIMLRILGRKIDKLKEAQENEGQSGRIDEEIMLELSNLNQTCEYRHKDFVNFIRVSPGASLWELKKMVDTINVEPTLARTQREMVSALAEDLKRFMDSGTVLSGVYNLTDESEATPEEIKRLIERVRIHLTRAYEEIRQKIGTHLSHYHLVNKYKTRCMWYDRERVRKLILNKQGKFIRQREQNLTMDLARYLFDNGLTVLYRAKFGQHEVDLVDPSVKNPVVVEAKTYKETGRKRLIQGISQLHAYMNNLTAQYSLEEGYYVIFRLDGPLYEFPEVVNTNKFRIFPILIDLGERKDRKPIVIDVEDLLEKIR